MWLNREYRRNPNRIRVLYWHMNPKQKQLPLHVKVWELMSTTFASLLVLAAAISVAYWTLTGTSLLAESPLDSLDQGQGDLFALECVLRLSCAIGVAVFLSTYLLGNVWRANAAPMLILVPILWSGNVTVISLVLGPMLAGGLVGHYFNIMNAKKDEPKRIYVAIRVLGLFLCGSIALVFAPHYPMPLLLVVLIWHLKCLIMLSGTIHFIWRRYTPRLIAT